MGGREDSLAWQLGLAGLAGFVAQGTVHGIETTMVRQQLASKPLHMVATARAIVGAEGVASLYRGFAAAGLRELSYTSLRFGLYEPLKKALGAEDPRPRLGALGPRAVPPPAWEQMRLLAGMRPL
ncbi:thiosulfate transmembrane transporter [Aureococcus anophagefferens]|uniref:Thiosulfate transmembrane transporter n=1 Tax=Aureococcus anophagefferens TaxID=44056 RepID=A0ABR1FR54_AURAN